MDTQQELISQQCIDLWRGLYSRRKMLRQTPYWAYDREGTKTPITTIIDTVNPARILDYGSGNGRAADILRHRDVNETVQVDCYDPAWPGADRVPTGSYDMVICYNVLNNVELDYLDRVCAHVESLVAKDLIIAIVVPTNRINQRRANYWIQQFPQLRVSYHVLSEPEETISMTGAKASFTTLFIWMYREPEEVIPPQPRVRVKKKGT